MLQLPTTLTVIVVVSVQHLEHQLIYTLVISIASGAGSTDTSPWSVTGSDTFIIKVRMVGVNAETVEE